MNANDGALASPLVTAVDGSCTLAREAIGSKAWGVNRMAGLGLPVPPAFVVTTAACRAFFLRGHAIDDDLWAQIVTHLARLEARTHRSFGAGRRPLLLSVRSGAAHSMPGMMDTILNLGINAEVERALARETGDAQYAADTRRRFVEQYRKVVLGSREELYRRSLGYSCAPRSPRCSTPGIPHARKPTVAIVACPTATAPPSCCRPWCSATPIRNPAPAYCSAAAR